MEWMRRRELGKRGGAGRKWKAGVADVMADHHTINCDKDSNTSVNLKPPHPISSPKAQMQGHCRLIGPFHMIITLP